MKPSRDIRPKKSNNKFKQTESLKLTGSQVNLSQRQESPRSSNTLPRCPNVRRRCSQHRPVSADLPDRSRTFGTTTIDFAARSRAIGSSAHSLCEQPPHFCTANPKYFWRGSHCRGSTGSTPCQASRQLDTDVDFIPGREDPFRHAYTSQSAQLLQTLLREPWRSESSEESSTTTPEHGGAKQNKTSDARLKKNGEETKKSKQDIEVDLKFERWFSGKERKDVRFELKAIERKEMSENLENLNQADSQCLVDLLTYEEKGRTDGNLCENVKSKQEEDKPTRLQVDLSWLEPEVLERRNRMGLESHSLMYDEQKCRSRVSEDNVFNYDDYGRFEDKESVADNGKVTSRRQAFEKFDWRPCDGKSDLVLEHNARQDYEGGRVKGNSDKFDQNLVDLSSDSYKYSEHTEGFNALRSGDKESCIAKGSVTANFQQDGMGKHFENCEIINIPKSHPDGSISYREDKPQYNNNEGFAFNPYAEGNEDCRKIVVNSDKALNDLIKTKENVHICDMNNSTTESKERFGTTSHDCNREVTEKKLQVGAASHDSVDENVRNDCRRNGEGNSAKVTPRDSTYEDLVSILNVLEGDETEPLLAESVPSARRSPIPDTGGKQVNEIFDYLDQVERCSEPVNVKTALRPSVSSTAAPMPMLNSATVPRLDELLCRSTVDLAQEVLALRLQAEEQANGLKLLQQTIADLKASAQEAKAALRAEMEKASNEAETALLRHQKMVKQLLAEKKSLNDKISSLVGEMKSTEERHQRNLKTMEERHLVELQRVKETQAAAEKLKREKWIDVKTQKIKEMTVKGLEPELSRMAARQQQELSELRSLHRAELEAVELRAARRTTELMDQLRVEMTRDKEEALQREAAALRARWDKQLEEEQRRHEEEVRRLKEENRRERDRIALLQVQFQESLVEAKRSAEREKERDRATIVREWEEKLEDVHRQHQTELKNAKESMEMEKEVWMNNYKKLQTNKFLEREAELHHQYKRERDRDIEVAIDRLETEEQKARLELQEAAENRLKRLRDKLEGEIRDLEAEVTSLKTKLSESKLLLAAKEDRVADLEAKLRHDQNELTQLKKLCEEMSAERGDLRMALRAEVAAELSAASEVVEAVREEMATLKASHAVELERREELLRVAKVEAEKELQNVYNRVKITIMKKEDAMETLREQYKVALERCSHLEQMLDNQRRNLLLK